MLSERNNFKSTETKAGVVALICNFSTQEGRRMLCIQGRRETEGLREGRMGLDAQLGSPPVTVADSEVPD